MKKVALYKQDIDKGNLVLVNAKYPVSSNYSPEILTNEYSQNLKETVLLERKVGIILDTLLQDIHALEKISLVSGYRSYEEQKELYEDSMKENGQEFTCKYVALPRCSEHQTGLAIDLGEKQDSINFICPSFPTKGITQIFRKKACIYGFIERYPRDKEKITGISYEPWHFRYIGYPHALIMEKHDLCLEEYIVFLKQYTVATPYSYYDAIHKIEIFYITMREDVYEMMLPPHITYQISGNNIDGFIVTVWRRKDV